MAEHHDFSKAKKSHKQEQPVTILTPFQRKPVINLPVITTVQDFQPAFTEREPDSISVHLRNTKTRSNHPVANMNISVFGHPIQNSSSHAFKELFGIKQSKDVAESTTPKDADYHIIINSGREFAQELSGEDDESIHSQSHKSGDQFTRQTPRHGGGNPGDSDRDDSDNRRGGSRLHQLVHEKSCLS